MSDLGLIVYEKYTFYCRSFHQFVLDWGRPEGWPESPLAAWPLARFEDAGLVLIGYVGFVLIGMTIMIFLPKIPGLYPLKFLYNVVQVMLCSYMCIEAGMQAYKSGYTLLPCNAFNHENPPIGFILYLFYLSKILDFVDTFFIIAEKRWKQLSFLHVYHHAFTFLSYWLNINVGYDGDVYFTIVLNGLIHTMMYTYYFVTMHSDKIWWKSALTIGQMTQFMLMNAQAIYLLHTGCKLYPVKLLYAYFAYVVSLLILFANFYVHSYIFSGGGKKKVKRAKTEKRHKSQ
jgi:elongation of very long chain fatty acids protein 4